MSEIGRVTYSGSFSGQLLSVMQKSSRQTWNGIRSKLKFFFTRIYIFARQSLTNRENTHFSTFSFVIHYDFEAAENVKYRGETLDAVATACLKEGKYENVKGADAEILDPRLQLDYCMQDAKLCLKLAQKDDYRVLTIFHNLSKEIGKDHDFFITCNYAKPTAWWRDFLKPLGYEKVTDAVTKWQEEHLRYSSMTVNGRECAILAQTASLCEVCQPIVTSSLPSPDSEN